MTMQVFSSPNSPPGWGVQAIVYYDSFNRDYRMVSGADYYIRRGNEVVGVDFCGVLDYVINELGVVWAGRHIPSTEYNAIFAQAMAERDRLNND